MLDVFRLQLVSPTRVSKALPIIARIGAFVKRLPAAPLLCIFLDMV